MQTACPNLKCPGLLILRQAQDFIYRGSHYECVYCHTHYPAAQIDNVEPTSTDAPFVGVPVDELDETFEEWFERRYGSQMDAEPMEDV